MYHKLIYDLKLLSDKYEATSQSRYIERLHDMLINDYPLEEVVEELVQALLSINDKDYSTADQESYEDGYVEGWNDAMSEVDNAVTYKEKY